MKVPVEKPGSPEEILHFGKKGMRWGVRQRYTQRIERTAARSRRVGSGKNASLKDKIKTHGTTSTFRVIQGKGLKGGARKRAASQEAHVRRLKAGKTTTIDKLRMVGGLRMVDVIGDWQD